MARGGNVSDVFEVEDDRGILFLMPGNRMGLTGILPTDQAENLYWIQVEGTHLRRWTYTRNKTPAIAGPPRVRLPSWPVKHCQFPNGE